LQQHGSAGKARHQRALQAKQALTQVVFSVVNHISCRLCAGSVGFAYHCNNRGVHVICSILHAGRAGVTWPRLVHSGRLVVLAATWQRRQKPDACNAGRAFINSSCLLSCQSNELPAVSRHCWLLHKLVTIMACMVIAAFCMPAVPASPSHGTFVPNAETATGKGTSGSKEGGGRGQAAHSTDASGVADTAASAAPAAPSACAVGSFGAAAVAATSWPSRSR